MQLSQNIPPAKQHLLKRPIQPVLVLAAHLCLTLVTPWTVARQAPLPMEFCRQEYRKGLPFPSPGDLPDPGIKPRPPALQGDSLASEPPPLYPHQLLSEPPEGAESNEKVTWDERGKMGKIMK